MKVLIVSFSVNGAMGDNFKLVTRYLRESNCKISVLTNTKTDLQSAKDFDVYEIPFNRENLFDFVNPKSYLRIFWITKKVKYDAVLFLSFHPVNLFLFKIIPANKVLFYLHDHEVHSGFPKFDTFLLNFQYNYLYSKNVVLIVSSNYMKKEILRKYSNLNPNRIKVIYLGLLDNLIFPIDKSLKEDIDVLFFGRIEYYKALDVLVNSYISNNQSYNCVIVGKGNLKEVFGIEHLPESITHINDYVPDEDLAKYIQRAKLVVMPYRDATGTQVIQSVFYYGKPIVATDVGCFPEYISDGEDGVIVLKENEKELNQAINLLLSNEKLRIKMGKKGRHKIDNIFSNDNINIKYLNALKSLFTL